MIRFIVKASCSGCDLLLFLLGPPITLLQDLTGFLMVPSRMNHDNVIEIGVFARSDDMLWLQLFPVRL